jgi:hypothetical protein
VTTYTAADAQTILERLATERAIVPLTDPVAIGNLLAAVADAYHNVAAHAVELDSRLVAIRQTVFPHLWEKTQRGDLARDVEAEADPHPENDAA